MSKEGTMWRSATRKQKIKGYDKEVLKHQKKTAKPTGMKKSQGKKVMKPPMPKQDEMVNEQLNQQIPEVSLFLGELGMTRYLQLFSETGIEDLETILELEGEHLDMMKIPLGHKLKMLKKIKELKSTQSSSQSTEFQKPTMSNAETQNDVSLKNPDLGMGEYDEAEQQRQFQEAVNSWRTTGKTESNSIQQQSDPEDPQIAMTMETKLGPKASCWNCFKLACKSDMKSLDDHDFCSEECIEKFKDKNYAVCDLGDCKNRFLKIKTGIILKSKWYCSEQCADLSQE